MPGPIVVLVGDPHFGSTTALCPPRVNLDDGGSYQYNNGQKWLWLRWIEFCGEVEKFIKPKGKRRRQMVIVFTADMIDGDHHNTGQIISRNMADQQRVARMGLEPLLKLRKKGDITFMFRGTEAHTGTQNVFEEQLGEMLGTERDPDTDTATWYYGLLNLGGVTFDVAHHGAAGRLPWTSASGAEKLSHMVMNTYWARGEQPPDIVVRGHVHKFILAGENNKTRVIILPSWQLTTAFGYRIDPAISLLPAGGAIIDIDKDRWPELEDGRIYKIFKRRYDPPRKDVWHLKQKT